MMLLSILHKDAIAKRLACLARPGCRWPLIVLPGPITVLSEFLANPDTVGVRQCGRAVSVEGR